MPQWRWRYAAWWVGFVPLIWPLALFADWMLNNSARRARTGPPEISFAAVLAITAVLIGLLVSGVMIAHLRAARRFSAVRRGYPGAVVLEVGVSSQTRASVEALARRRLSSRVVASAVVAIADHGIALHHLVDPARPALFLRWDSIGGVGIVTRGAIHVVVEIAGDPGATEPAEPIVLSLPMALIHARSPWSYATRRSVLESALERIAPWSSRVQHQQEHS